MYHNDHWARLTASIACIIHLPLCPTVSHAWFLIQNTRLNPCSLKDTPRHLDTCSRSCQRETRQAKPLYASEIPINVISDRSERLHGTRLDGCLTTNRTATGCCCTIPISCKADSRSRFVVQCRLSIHTLARIWLTSQNTFPSPPFVLAHGLEPTHRLEVIKAVLQAQQKLHAVIRCHECLSTRHSLSKILTACLTLLGIQDQGEQYDRLDNVNALQTSLEKMFRKHKRKVVVVLDGWEEEKGQPPTLLPALARLGDLVCDRPA
jgi:hypothetical protein